LRGEAHDTCRGAVAPAPSGGHRAFRACRRRIQNATGAKAGTLSLEKARVRFSLHTATISWQGVEKLNGLIPLAPAQQPAWRLAAFPHLASPWRD